MNLKVIRNLYFFFEAVTKLFKSLNIFIELVFVNKCNPIKIAPEKYKHHRSFVCKFLLDFDRFEFSIK
jgi:hypothetical protein